MPRLDAFKIKVTTGERGTDKEPQYAINGFEVEFDDVTGGTAPGETMEAKGSPQSFPHALVLIGPDEGEWDLAGAEVTYELEGEEPYTVRLGPATLDGGSNLNIWHKRPPRVIDV